MNAANGPTATIITPTATTTAMTMIGKYSVMPTAVMMLSTEKTMSIMMIWMRPAMRPSGAAGFSSSASSSRIDAVVDFGRRLPDQEQAARQQQQIAYGKSASKHRGQRLRENAPATTRKRAAPGETRAPATGRVCAQAPPAFVDAVREQRDEHQIVEAEDDLHGDQGRERRPCVGVLRPGGEDRPCAVEPQSSSFDPTTLPGRTNLGRLSAFPSCSLKIAGSGTNT